MPFSSFDDDTRRRLTHVLDGAILVLEAMKSDAMTEDRRPATMARLTTQLVAAAATGQRDFETLQLMALDGIE